MKIKFGSNGFIVFWCPGCGSIHTMPVKPAPNGWVYNGDVERPTISPSILVKYPSGITKTWEICHSFVRDGKIQFLGDCTHSLANQTVDIPDWDTRHDCYL